MSLKKKNREFRIKDCEKTLTFDPETFQEVLLFIQDLVAKKTGEMVQFGEIIGKSIKIKKE